MPDEHVDDSVAFVVRTLQIIVAAMCGGVVLFLVAATVVGPIQPVEEGAQPLLTWVMIAFAVTALAVSLFLPNLITMSARTKILAKVDPEAAIHERLNRPEVVRGLAQIYQVKTIVGAGLLEGGALAATVAYLLEHQFYAAVVAVLLTAFIAFLIPTRPKVIGWIEEQQRRLENEQATRQD